MNPIISVENLSKQYRIGTKLPYKTFREAIMNIITSPAKLFRHPMPSALCSMPPSRDGYIWALKDVSFEVKEGEVLGIIGRNGAGKTTLLKVLSRVTEPTKGEVKIRGRVGSLLEVGTGFHPELTGRENIFLNGAILGMRKEEIKEKFDEIVAFSEVEKFLDTPMKRYSSGMYVRLAFAVAAHLEPEILLVDEVLAVGDAQFQKKCLGKMGEVSKEGRTVLFVSHNLQAIRNLCPRSIFLNNGEVISDATTEKSLSHYSQFLHRLQIDDKTAINNELVRRGGGSVRFTSVSVYDVNGKESYSFEMGETIRFKMSYKVFKEIRGLSVYIALRSGITREIVTSVKHLISSAKIGADTTGTVIIELPDVYIRPGEYPIYLHISESLPTKTNFDVLDDLTAPLVITAGSKKQESNFDPSQSLGYFSLPSRIFSNEIHKN
jgi:lipopolysaccharide transport system ATP-binding protein